MRLRQSAKAHSVRDLERQTIDDFGTQWKSFNDVDTGYYGESELFDDIAKPFLSRSDIRGKYIAVVVPRCAGISVQFAGLSDGVPYSTGMWNIGFCGKPEARIKVQLGPCCTKPPAYRAVR